MTARRHVVVLIVACLVSVGAMVGLMGAALLSVDRTNRRVAAISERLAELGEISAQIGAYGQQSAEILLFAASEARDLSAARIAIERSLARLTQATRAEILSLDGMAEVTSELPEIEESRRIVELYHAIDASMNNVLSSRRADPSADSLGAFERAVSFRVANELQPLLTHAAEGERDEIAAQLQKSDASRAVFVTSAAALAVLSLLILGGLALALRRSIVSPIEALTGHAAALAAGRPVPPGALPLRGDFAALSASLAAVERALAEQRERFAEAGERLGSEVETRTAQLRSANEQLREIDRRRGQFLADVSHELRTPLTILRGEADVALRGAADPVLQRQSLERIQGQAAELGHLLEDLIEFARSTAEDQPFVMVDTQLDEVVAAAAQEGRMLAEAREVVVTLDLQDQARHIEADFRRLKQALIIGLDNAIKHSPPGSTVTVATASDAQTVRISILDEGGGIDEADLPRVFERFFRGRDQHDSLATGLGIGLAIAKDIVERHGGTIGLDNRNSGGAALTIVLPAGEPAA